MDLLAVGLWGYKRFEHDHGNLDVAGNPIAIVGPNEVGKTSFLRALLHLSEEGAFDASELTRRGTGEACVRAVFALEEEDYDAIAGVGGKGRPVIFDVWKRESGRLQTKLEPALTRNREPREKVQGALARIKDSRWWKALDAEDELAEAIAEVHDRLSDDEETLDDEVIEKLRSTADRIATTEDAPASAKPLVESLRELAKHEEARHPDQAARAILFRRRPRFLWFPEDRRQIESVYSLADAPSAALANLLALIDFDLDQLRRAVRSGDRATVAELMNEANAAFSRLFEGRWRQANVRVELDMDGDAMHIFVTNAAGRLIPIAERSEGLRHFIALLAFVEHEAAGEDAIVLVDEAEQHLHYDAQADLVRVFSGQTAAEKIIYSTHSAGCLPHDLGMGVRVLEPTGPEEISPEEWDRSKIQNWFYTRGPGFSPLLFAMGASTFAFAGARKAVVGEGASDALLLPTLLREATGLPALDYQVAPGLANVSERGMAELDLVASRVAHLVDGDEGGKARRAKLIEVGIPKERILVLGEGRTPLSIEDVTRKELYVRAVNRELELRYGVQLPVGEIPDVGRKKALERWCEGKTGRDGHAVNVPSERAVAHHLLDALREARLRGETVAVVEPKRGKLLERLHRNISALLERPTHETM